MFLKFLKEFFKYGYNSIGYDSNFVYVRLEFYLDEFCIIL